MNMTFDIQSAIQESAKALESKASDDANKQPASEDKPEDKPVEESKPEVKEESTDKVEKPEDKEEKPKKSRSLEDRINAKHKQMLQERESRVKAEEQLAVMQKQIEELQTKKSEPKGESDEPSEPETIKDLLALIDGHVASKTDDLIKQRLAELLEHQERSQKQNHFTTIANEFGKMLDDEFADFDPEVPDNHDEVKLIVERFKSDPEFWLDFAKKHGIKEMRSMVTGKFKQVKQDSAKDKLKQMLDTEDKVSTAKSGMPMGEEDEMSKAKTVIQMFEAASRMIKKKGGS